MSRGGNGLLADDLFLLAHDEITGRPRLHPRVTGIGLAGALLGELTLFRRVDIRADPDGREFVVVTEREPIDDALANAVLRQVMADGRPRTVRAWLGYLAQTASHNVGERLGAAGLVARAHSRLPRRATRLVPTDMATAAWPATRLRLLLGRMDHVTVPDAALAGFAVACGLAQQILWDTPPSARQYLDYLVANLPAALRALLAQTENAVSDAVLSRPI
jgi:Golgi phosphoprotein 3 (GPP34)